MNITWKIPNTDTFYAVQDKDLYLDTYSENIDFLLGNQVNRKKHLIIVTYILRASKKTCDQFRV